MFDPAPPNYHTAVVSSRWLHAEMRLTVSFQDLILHEKVPALDAIAGPAAAPAEHTAQSGSSKAPCISLNAQSAHGGELPGYPSCSLKLEDFESALARIAAMILWVAAQLSQGGYEPEIGGANCLAYLALEFIAPIHLLHPQINLTPILFGLCASVIMLLLAVVLAGARRDKDTLVVSSVGMLEMLWLSNRKPVLRLQLDEVQEPTMDNLRSAGMFQVCLSEDFAVEESGE
ncbi:hypothetical protein CONPUDRAFT_142341 [Coniophora puteana RWD-64-598 SS2]|uniref:Uncharacterized protein n=1 Tax=Coniophora puteana (strain RWD-64-598) TaxID=741705 RepID=A0A5M3MX58_CONPW|nr:uncharacterized protein CONPUDRAFT_142341 [Coniophora puteana RWD-64-598 SS2]EIW83729.1 hypothetical protein CONPUDRAFT_142341 [Coniophora puteana RWD-64-598 SS2]